LNGPNQSHRQGLTGSQRSRASREASGTRRGFEEADLLARREHTRATTPQEAIGALVAEVLAELTVG
jgi:hypothetical protein